jgi:hypothetical protein
VNSPLVLLGIIPAAGLPLSVGWLCIRTRDRREKRLARKPDYPLIARLEREIYGESFHHDGAHRREPVHA